MKLELLKSIITDLHLAGIHDIPSNAFMDQEKIESQELVLSVFNQTANTEITAIFNNEEFNENSIANEMNELFAAFGSGKRPDLGDMDLIEATAPKQAKKPARAKPAIIDPRLKEKPSNLGDLGKSINRTSAYKDKNQLPKLKDFKPDDFISTKIESDSKFILLLPYKDEKSLMDKPDFRLLENILKSANTNYNETSVIFIDESYKNITLGDEKLTEKLAKKLEETLKCNKQMIILSFGQDCLKLTNKEVSTVREASSKVLDVFENKKLLANYSLSAMVNTPKYKTTTWTNLLLIKRI